MIDAAEKHEESRQLTQEVKVPPGVCLGFVLLYPTLEPEPDSPESRYINTNLSV
jgi:hypothetical protein